jgi:hypothetical protein
MGEVATLYTPTAPPPVTVAAVLTGIRLKYPTHP